MTPPEAKSALRTRMRDREIHRPADGGGIAEVLHDWAVWQSARAICAYAALPGECDVLDPWPLGKQVALPRVSGGELSAHWVGGPDDLVCGSFGIWEPAPSTFPTSGEFDVILVPGLAFDVRGGRLGRGKGHYDRFLAATKGLRVGVCFDDQIVESVPCESHDIAMDFLVTAGGWTPCGQKNMR